jgi:UDP-N-acetylmuramoyl-L-alanyl-D-glutamate--2,6-diaminopimelate ligase
MPPARRVYVTGTNGKTTTTTMLAAIAEAAGEPSARVTTLGTFVGGARIATEPTLEAYLELLAKAEAIGARAVFVEASSQALADGFAHRFPPDVGVFTNLTRDHLDAHGDFEHYLASKAQLFVNLRPGGVAVLDVADPASALLDEVTPAGVERRGYAARPAEAACGRIPQVLVSARINLSRDGTRVRLASSDLAKRLGGELVLRVIGDVHAENALAAAVAADALGYAAVAIKRGLEGFAGVAGRFEVVLTSPLVAVDYAHTPDALDRTLSLARVLARQSGGRVLAVFGCGGDRDAGKRAPMGAIAARLAELVIITTDNPRSEEPSAIAAAIAEGAAGGPGTVVVLEDRRTAIEHAVASARAEDVIVIAGKGHEAVQILRDRTVPFDDAEVVRACRPRQR